MITSKLRFLKPFYQIPIYLIVLGYILFEKLIWETIAEPVALFIKRLYLFKKLEQLINMFNKYIVLLIFVSLFVFVELLTPVSFSLMGKGMVIQGVLVYIGKLPLTSFAFWVLAISKERLLTIVWFNKVYSFFTFCIGWVKGTSYYLNVIDFYLKIKDSFKSRKEVFLLRFFKRIYSREKNNSIL